LNPSIINLHIQIQVYYNQIKLTITVYFLH